MATTASNIACSSKLLQPVAIRGGMHTAGIVRSVYIHATAHYSKICRSVCVRLCVCRKVYCGKMAEWIRMPFGIVSGVSRMMDVLDGVVIVEGKGQFWGEFGASHCNQWGLCWIVLQEWCALLKLLWGLVSLLFMCREFIWEEDWSRYHWAFTCRQTQAVCLYSVW